MSKYKFDLERKIQTLKWYYNGNSLQELVNTLISKYGKDNVLSKSSIRHTAKMFEIKGCIQFQCRKCSGYVCKRPEKTEEDELNEIMVCAAAELELSIKDISVELELERTKVFRILKKNGYTSPLVIEEPTEDVQEKDIKIEKWSAERKQIVKWYCLKNTLSNLIQLFIDNFKDYKVLDYDSVKEEILNAIYLFELYGCLRNCPRCLKNINESKTHLKICDIEELIFKRSTELDIHENNGRAQMKSANMTTEKAEKSPNSKNVNKRKHSLTEQNIEFVTVEPTMKLIVVDKNDSEKKIKSEEVLSYTVCSNWN